MWTVINTEPSFFQLQIILGVTEGLGEHEKLQKHYEPPARQSQQAHAGISHTLHTRSSMRLNLFLQLQCLPCTCGK